MLKLVKKLNLGVTSNSDKIPFSVGGFEELILNGLSPMGIENYIQHTIDLVGDDYEEWLIFMDEKFGGITNLQLTHEMLRRLTVRPELRNVEKRFIKDYLLLMDDEEFEDFCYSLEVTGITTLKLTNAGFTNERLQFVLDEFEPIQKSVNYSIVYGLNFNEWLELDLKLLEQLSNRINVDELVEDFELTNGMVDYFHRGKEAIADRSWLGVVDLYFQKRRTVQQPKQPTQQTQSTQDFIGELDIEKSVKELSEVLKSEKLHKMSKRFDRFLTYLALDKTKNTAITANDREKEDTK
jgi:hypothetical protein